MPREDQKRADLSSPNESQWYFIRTARVPNGNVSHFESLALSRPEAKTPRGKPPRRSPLNGLEQSFDTVNCDYLDHKMKAAG